MYLTRISLFIDFLVKIIKNISGGVPKKYNSLFDQV